MLLQQDLKIVNALQKIRQRIDILMQFNIGL